MMAAPHDYGVKVIRAYAQFSVGTVIFPPGMVRSQLLDGGFVEAVKPPDERAPRGVRRTSAERA